MFGLTVSSEGPLPDLPGAQISAAPDVVIRQIEMAPQPPPPAGGN